MYGKKVVPLLSLFIVCILVMGVVATERLQCFNPTENPIIQSEASFEEAQGAFDNIYIDEDSDFRDLGFPGTGDPLDPFIIEGYSLSNSISNLIHIQDTTAYFEIRNCELDGLTKDHYGILLWNVRNAKVTSNVIQNCRDGIHLETILDSSVTGNTISDCLERGILLQDSSSNEVSSNLVTGCRMGFLLYNAPDNTLSGNTFELLTYDPSINPSIFGFHLSWCPNTLLSGNRITIPISVSTGVHIAGFYLQYCSDATIIENTIEIEVSLFGSGASHVYGFIMLTCDDNELTGNIVSLRFQGDVYGYYLGMHLEWSNRNTLSRNDIRISADNPPASFEAFCIRLAECELNTLLENNVLIDATGHILSEIHLHSSDSNSVFDNTITGGQTGISLLNCEGNTISGNTADGCSLSGINLVDCIYTTVSDNIVMHSLVGDRLINSDHTTLTGNTVWECDWGMYLDWSSHSLIFHNNFIDNLVQAVDFNSEYGNDWYHPDLLEGNYWSDYPGVDDGSGTEKHAIAGDLIGDTAIPWPGEGFDYYPFVIPLNIEDLIEYIIGKVQELIDCGVLNYGAGQSLIIKLDVALAKISLGMYTSALRIIGSFISQVNAFENTGILTNEEAQYFINLAILMIELIP